MKHIHVVAIGTTVMLAFACGAGAQVTPERLYCGVDRPIPVEVKAEGARKAELLLLEGGSARELGRAEVQAGKVDLRRVFESLRGKGGDGVGEADKSEPRVVYVQLAADGRKVGPAVVVQPMLTPAYAPRLDRTGAPMWGAGSGGQAERERSRVFSGYRVYVDKDIVLETSAGSVRISLHPEQAPSTCWNFRELAEGGMYTDVVFHRVASLSGRPGADIIQTGDPNGTGQGGPGYYIDLEQSGLAHDFGVVSGARLSDPNSCGSQFYISMNREGTAYLDGRYTAFGEVLNTPGAAQTLRTIAATPVKSDNRPLDPPLVKSAVLSDAAPYGEGPGRVREPAGGR